MEYREHIGWGFSLDNRVSHKRIYFGINVSKYIQECVYTYVGIEKRGLEDKMVFSKEQKTGYYRINLEEKGNSSKCATVYNKELIQRICLKKKQKLYYYKMQSNVDGLCPTEFWYIEKSQISKDMDLFQGEYKKCAKCGRELPTSEFYAKGKHLQSYCKDCMKNHGRLRNGTTGVYRKPGEGLSRYSDKELYDELRNRGYEGKLVKQQTLG